MTKLQELENELETIKNEVSGLMVENKVEEAHAKLAEIETIKKSIKVEKALEEENEIEDRKEDVKMENTIKGQAFALRAMIKDMNNFKITDEEAEALKDYKNVTGESYILPVEVSTKIVELVKSFKSFENVVGTKTTSEQSGSFPMDKTEDIELQDFVDGTGVNDSDNLDFEPVTFKLKEKGAIIPLTNTLLKFTDNDLIDFVARKFARRYVTTINKMAIEALKKDKTMKEFTTIHEIVKCSQSVLDLEVAGVVVTNQSGFTKMASAKNEMGVGYIQPDITKPAVLMIDGRPVVVFSDKQLPNVDATKAPVFMGDLEGGVWRVGTKDRYKFALGEDFRKNQTLTRIITYLDVIQVDKADDRYVYGALSLA